MEVGIREFKARLSHYVKVARSGEQVVLTERGRPVARLTAAITEGAPHMPPSLASLIEQGRVRAPSRMGRWASIAGVRATRSVSQILDEDRGGG